MYESCKLVLKDLDEYSGQIEMATPWLFYLATKAICYALLAIALAIERRR